MKEKLFVLTAEKQEVGIQLGATLALVTERDAKIATLNSDVTKLNDDKEHLARNEAKLAGESETLLRLLLNNLLHDRCLIRQTMKHIAQRP